MVLSRNVSSKNDTNYSNIIAKSASAFLYPKKKPERRYVPNIVENSKNYN